MEAAPKSRQFILDFTSRRSCRHTALASLLEMINLLVSVDSLFNVRLLKSHHCRYDAAPPMKSMPFDLSMFPLH